MCVGLGPGEAGLSWNWHCCSCWWRLVVVAVCGNLSRVTREGDGATLCASDEGAKYPWPLRLGGVGAPGCAGRLILTSDEVNPN